MQRIFLHIVFALALILQGSGAAFGALAHKHCCCTQAAASLVTHDSQCPCHPHKACGGDCQMLCISNVAGTLPESAIAVTHSNLGTGIFVFSDAQLPPHGVAPLLRPPIA
jgi:hypothetical protein